MAEMAENEKRKYIYISPSFVGSGVLNSEQTLDELISLIARDSRLTGIEIEKCLLDCINAMLVEEQE